ncbi:MAG: tyrosine-protein phosphatase [Candidatus Tectomicrobia bacterium]
MKRRFLIGAVVLGVTLTTVSAVWLGSDNFHAVIADELYRRAQPDPEQLEGIIARHDINTIINLRGPSADEASYTSVRAVAERFDVKYYDIDLNSRELPYITELLKLLEILQQAERPILVHCLDGADRSGLASAVALLIRNGYELRDARWQTSLRYRVAMADSIGKQFLAQYESWLQATAQRHTPARFLDWVRNDYVDSRGNLWFYLDSINFTVVSQNEQTRLSDGYAFQIDGNTFRAQGWGFDLRNRRLLKHVTVMLDDRPLAETRYGGARKDVADYFHIPEVEASGWEVNKDLSGWPRRCYNMSLQLTRANDSIWRSPTQARVCLR